ncbi:MAG: AAA family ATPase [Lachnospiraceae bacterium]|nr:AAA family ATPase [Lachnospiraceae bacterium]
MGKMLRANLIFDRDWVTQKGSVYDERPVELIVYAVKSDKKAEIIACSYTSLIVRMDELGWDDFAQWLESFVREYFEEENIWKYVEVEGGIKGWKPKQKTEEEQKNLLLQKKLKQLRENLSNAGAFDDDMFAETGDPVAAEEEDEEKNWRERKRAAESKITSLLQEHEVFSDCPPLREHLEYVKDMALTMMKMNALDSLWSKKLLVSMDSGFGFSTFVCALFDILEACGIVKRSRSPKNLAEYCVEKSKSGGTEVWKKLIGSLQLLDESIAEGSVTPGVIAIDITEWEEDLGKPELQEYLRQVAEYSRNFLCVFRIQLLEESSVRKIEQIIDKVMPVQSRIVYSPSIEEMAEYLNRRLKEQGFLVTPRKWENWDLSCDREQFAQWNSRKPLNLLEQWINEERRSPQFFGYKSLDNMADRLIYIKAENNVRKGEYSKEITVDDMQELLDITEETVNPWDELNSLIGMQSVKDEIKKIVLQLKAIKNPADRPSLHMKFVGNPGTGKTTIARIVAKILDYEKLLTRGGYIEVHGRELCTEHVGGTAIRTRQYCRDAYGSVLFVDEAYSLYSDKDSRDVGKEAVAVLVKQMEDHRNDMCVIMAGYKDDMKQLESMNVGLKGRLNEVEFPNYSREELIQIFFRYLDKDAARMGIRYDAVKIQKAVEAFFLNEKLLPEEKLNERDFSNARFVRNIYEAARGEAICRTGLNGAETLELKEEDIRNVSERFVPEETNNRIGFY